MQVSVDIVRLCGRAVIDIGYILDIFGAQGVLNLAFFVFVVGIDKEHLLTGSGTGAVDNQNGSGNAGTVKKGRWQT